MTIKFRRPEVDEVEAFAAVNLQCWREAYSGFLPAALVARFDVVERTEAWWTMLAKPERFVLGAYDDETSVGFISSGPSQVKHIETQDGHLAAIYILASHHRLGIGRKLIAAAAQDWLAHSGKTITVGVLAENLAARAFYEALGARLLKAGTYNWDGFDLPECLYIWQGLAKIAKS